MPEQSEDQPIHLIEDEETGDRFLVYGSDRGARLDIQFTGDTLWMTQAQIAELFGKDRTSITKHIANILDDGELDEATCVNKLHISQGRPAFIYNLDMIISVGYRVSSTQATLFRRWATSILVQYAKKGFVVDALRLKQPGNIDRITELREIIRDIRSDEANLYAELKRICALCQDYDCSSDAARGFFKNTQAKLVNAVASQTPAEIVCERADPIAPNMGLQNWSHDNIRKADVTISKNYLTAAELKELNRLTDILLSIFEDQLELGRLVVMADAWRLLDEQLANLGRVVLQGGGKVSGKDMKTRVEQIYDVWNQQRKLERKNTADEAIAALAAEAKKLPKR